GSNSRSVAELALGLLFALARKIPAADRSMKEGKWEKSAFKGIELSGKTLGILGFGNVGKILANLAKGIGMNIVIWSREEDRTEQYPFFTDLDDFLPRADAISIHVPKIPETENLLNEKTFTLMKNGAYLINTARGGIVEEGALLAALQSGKIAGAALDVFIGEPSPNEELVRHPNVIATPHIAASTTEAQTRASEEVVRKIIDFKGE
ncbi:3-phosphoglycerate dehydrogenase, partial [bacterium]|nr:3-phosphoglycerate dehydrogenase [bacterium]